MAKDWVAYACISGNQAFELKLDVTRRYQSGEGKPEKILDLQTHVEKERCRPGCVCFSQFDIVTCILFSWPLLRTTP